MRRASIELSNLETLILALNNSSQNAILEIQRLKNYISKLDETFILTEKNQVGEFRIRY